MAGTSDPFKMFSFPVMQSTFCFADVKILAVPTTSLIQWRIQTVTLSWLVTILLCALNKVEPGGRTKIVSFLGTVVVPPQ